MEEPIPPINKLNKTTIIGIVLIVITAVIIGGIFIWLINQEPVSVENDLPATIVEKLDEEKVDDTTTLEYKKVFAPDNSSLYYQENSAGKSVGVYLEKDNETLKIIDHVPLMFINNQLSGTAKFKITSNPNVNLLSVRQTAVYSHATHYFINTDNLDITRINIMDTFGSLDINTESITIIDSNNEQSVILTSFRGNCLTERGGIYNTYSCKVPGEAYLEGLTLNGEKLTNLIDEQVIECFDHGGIGGCVAGSVYLSYQGINQDLSKIFFSLGYSEGGENILNHNFSFDISSKEIILEEPSNLLEISNISDLSIDPSEFENHYSIQCSSIYFCDMVYLDEDNNKASIFIFDILKKLRGINAIGANDGINILGVLDDEEIILEHRSGDACWRSAVLYEVNIEDKNITALGKMRQYVTTCGLDDEQEKLDEYENIQKYDELKQSLILLLGL